MSWSGGTYSKGNSGTGGWAGDAASGIGIEAGRHDTQDNDFATGINNCIAKDGQNTPTNDLPMGGYHHTGVSNATANDQYAAWGQLRNGAPVYLDTANTRLGVGTSSPAVTVDVQSTTAAEAVTRFSADTSGSQIILRKSRGASVGTNTIVSSGDQIGNITFQGANGTGYTDAASIAAAVDATPGAVNDMPGNITFSTTPDASGTLTERVRIANTGKVGIAVTSPTTTLDMASTDGFNLKVTRYENGVGPANLYLQHSRGATIGTNTIVQSGDGLGAIYFFGANGTGFDPAAAIIASVDTTPGATNDMPGRLGFYTTADGAASVSERMRIDSVGNIGIAVTPLSNSRFTVTGIDTASNYAIVIRNSGGANNFTVRNDGQMNVGTAAASPYNSTTASAANAYLGSGGEFQRSTSSLKYKTDIQDAVHGLADVLNLRAVTYKGKNDGDRIFGGLIAEEVDAAGLTEFVQYAEDGSPDALAYGNMVSLAFKAIQELNAKVESLETRVAALENA